MATIASTFPFEFERGSHVCVFYRTDEELLDVLAPYIAGGLRNGERCFCVQKPRVAQRLKGKLHALGVNAEKEIERGALEIHLAQEVYLSDGVFSPGRMMDLLGAAVRNAIAENFTGLRTAGDLSWVAHGHHDCQVMIEYERMVDASFPNQPAIGMCQYQITDFSPGVLSQVLSAHQLAFVETAPDSHYHTLSVRWGPYSIDFVGKRLLRAGCDFVIQHREHGALAWGGERTFDAARAGALALIPTRQPAPHRIPHSLVPVAAAD